MVEPLKWVKSNRFALVVAFFIGVFLWVCHPALYNADGYGYLVGGYDPKQTLNPHHVIWVPIVWAMIMISQLAHLDPIPTLQLFGVLCVATTSFFAFSFLRQRIGNTFLVVILVGFIFSSPWLWLFSFQNQPYSLLFLVTALLLKTLAPENATTISTSRLWLGGLLVCLAIGLHQATVFWVPAIAVYLWKELPRKGRILRCAAWIVGPAFFSIGAYAWAARVQDLWDWPDFIDWFTEYVHDQHAIQFHLGTSFLQSAFGITHTFFQASDIDELLMSHYPIPTIAWIYAAFLVSLTLGLWAFYRRLPVVTSDLQTNCRSRKLIVSVLSAWCLFCLFWEPVNYYWCVALVPFVYLVAISFGNRIADRPTPIAVLLIFSIGWNLESNIKVDRYFEPGAPTRLVPKIIADLSPSDRYIVISKGRPKNADYGIIGFSLTNAHRENQVCLIDDIVLTSKDGYWQDQLADLFEDTWKKGGKVFLTQAVLDPYAFQVADSMLSPYKQTRFNHLNSASLYEGMTAFLRRYRVGASEFQLADDQFFRIQKADR